MSLPLVPPRALRAALLRLHAPAAVSSYFAGLTAAQQPAAGYVVTGRGYPDVAMAGLNYEAMDQIQFTQVKQ